MSERALKRILAAVAVVVAAYAAVALVRGGPSTPADEGTEALRALLSSLDPAGLDEVRFVRDGDTVRLAREGAERWMVNGHRADSATVARFWNQLAEARVGGVVARNPDNHDRLGVTDAAAARVTFEPSDGSGSSELLVGDPGPTGRSAYVRVPGEETVHLVHGDLRGAARREVDSWRDRTIVRVDTSRVQSIELVREEGADTLRREDGAWRVGEATADSAAVRGLLTGLARLRASGFAPDTVSVDPVERRLVATGSGTDTLAALDLAAADGSRFLVRAEGDSIVYEISSFEQGRLFPDELAADQTDGGPAE